MNIVCYWVLLRQEQDSNHKPAVSSQKLYTFVHYVTRICFTVLPYYAIHIKCFVHFALSVSLDTMCVSMHAGVCVCVHSQVHVRSFVRVQLCLATFRKAYMSGHSLHQQFVE